MFLIERIELGHDFGTDDEIDIGIFNHATFMGRFG
jgi:hypothetical protein